MTFKKVAKSVYDNDSIKERKLTLICRRSVKCNVLTKFNTYVGVVRKNTTKKTHKLIKIARHHHTVLVAARFALKFKKSNYNNVSIWVRYYRLISFCISWTNFG